MSTLYEDRGFSGSHPRRQGFQSLLAGLKRGLIDVVVVHRLDRLTRNLSDFQQIIAEFNAHNVASVSVTQRLPLVSGAGSHHVGRLATNIPVSFAEIEREMVGQCVMRRCTESIRPFREELPVEVRDYIGGEVLKPLP